MPMIRPKMELSMQAVSGMVANLYKADAEIFLELQQLARRFGEELQQQVEFYTPVDTGFMQAHVRLMFSNDGTVFEVGWLADDFFSEGLAFYPWFVEYGTAYMAAQLPLTSAYGELAPLYEAEVGAAVSRAIQRISLSAA